MDMTRQHVNAFVNSRLCTALAQQPEARVHLLGLLIQQIPYIKVPGILFIQAQPAKQLKNVVVGTEAGFRLWLSVPLEEELHHR